MEEKTKYYFLDVYFCYTICKNNFEMLSVNETNEEEYSFSFLLTTSNTRPQLRCDYR